MTNRCFQTEESCRSEIETLRPIIASFVDRPTDVLRPSVSLWGRLAQRIAKDTGKEPLLPPPELPAKPEWEEAAPGIFCKLLATDTEKNCVSMMVRLAPGTIIRLTAMPEWKNCICCTAS